MGICLRRAGLAVAVFVLCTGLVAGCSEEPPEPSTIGSDNTASKTPGPTPTATSTLPTEEQQAVNAATAAYERWIEVIGEVYTAPQNYTSSEIVAKVRKVGGDPLAARC